MHRFAHNSHKQPNEAHGYRQPVPDERIVVRMPVIIPRTNAYHRHAKKECKPAYRIPCQTPAGTQYGTSESDDQERSIGYHVREIRDSEKAAPIGKLVIARILMYRREAKQNQERCSSDQEKEVMAPVSPKSRGMHAALLTRRR